MILQESEICRDRFLLMSATIIEKIIPKHFVKGFSQNISGGKS